LVFFFWESSFFLASALSISRARNREKWLAALRTLLADWTPAERQEFARLFARLNDAMETNNAMERQ
jgi:DNA-binding MarR family transcriptional regulator